MTGVFTDNPPFSRITLALLEDTGYVHLCGIYLVLCHYILELNNYRDSIHYHDSLTLFMNKIGDC